MLVDLCYGIVPLESLSIYLCTLFHYLNGRHASKLFDEFFLYILSIQFHNNNQLTVICTTHVECLLIRVKLLILKLKTMLW